MAKGGFALTLKWLPHVPDRWRRLVRKMMNDNTTARFQSADQVLSALSHLPIEPDWACEVTSARIQWEREAKGRRTIVQWDRLGSRRNEWRAWSEPLGTTGRNKTLGGSNGVVGTTQAIKELENFFGV